MKNKIYGQVDTDTKEILKNPGFLPKVFKLKNGKQITGFDKLNKDKLKKYGYFELSDKEPTKPEFDEKTEKIIKVYEYKNGLIEACYKVEKVKDNTDIFNIQN